MARSPLPGESDARKRLEREAAAMGSTVAAILAERALRRAHRRGRPVEALIEERTAYLEGCRRSEIDDTLENIRSIEQELEWLLRIHASPLMSELWRTDPDACFVELRRPRR